MILRVPCPTCGFRYLMVRAQKLSPDGQKRHLYTADIVDPDAPLLCAQCGYEGPVPRDARMTLLNAERLPGV